MGDESVAAAVEAAGGRPVTADGGFEDVALVVAAGEAALVDLARSPVEAPVLPVDAGDGVRPVSADAIETAVGRVLDGDCETIEHPVVSTVGPGGEGTAPTATALFDVALVAAEPARISEFEVRCGDDRVDRFRADGVVASTPAGSAGYNRAADGPVVAPGSDVVAVVPLAPFATHADRWVLPLESVTLSVQRNETPVELLADGRTEGAVGAGSPVSLSRSATLETVVVPESDPFF